MPSYHSNKVCVHIVPPRPCPHVGVSGNDSVMGGDMGGGMRLNDRHAYLTRELPDGRVLDVQPWPDRRVRLVVSASRAPWTLTAIYWYGDLGLACVAALLWDGVGVPRWGRGRTG